MTDHQQLHIRRRASAHAGFTLLELLVSLGVFSVLLGVLVTFSHSQIRLFRAQTVKQDVKQGADVGIGFLLRELRSAGARPAAYPGATDCPSAPIPTPSPPPSPACSGFERVTAADADSITIQYDFRGDNPGDTTDGCPDDPNEVITYTFDDTTQEIERAIDGGTPALLVSGVSDLVFEYFDQDAIQLPASGGLSESDRAAIQSIDMTLTLSTPHPDPHIGGMLTFTLTSTVFLRNPPC